MKIVNKKITDLIEAEYNPRKLNEDQHKQLKDSLLAFGIVDPVLINTNKERKNIIIGGHQRTKVWQELGNDTIPCIELDLSIDKEKELNIRLNKNTGQFDFDLLDEYFDKNKLIEFGFQEHEFEFDSVELSDEFSEKFSLPDGDKAPFQQQTYTLADAQAEQIKKAISDIKQTEEYKYIETFGNENSNGNALYLIISQWEEQKK